MQLVERLAEHALENHADQATAVLERFDAAETVHVLEGAGAESGAAVLERLSPHYAAAVLQGLAPERAARFLGVLPVDGAARILRRVEPAAQEAILAASETRRARSIRRVLGFREGTAGALMDPDVLALPAELSAGEALARVRQLPELARYNLYVVGAGQQLVGAFNLRELLLAREESSLAELMQRNPHRVLASADRASVMAHPGWKHVHALPVVDEEGAFLGAIRYRVLKQLEDDLMGRTGQDLDSAAAFGELIAAGARGVLDAFSGTVGARSGGGSDGGR